MKRNTNENGPVAWMAGNSVAANLLMGLLLAGGLLVGIFGIKQEVFPDFDLDMINIRVSLPGSSPEEVESGIILAIEEAVHGLEGVKQITSTAVEGSGTITIEAFENVDITRLWQEAKSEVDRIDTLPEAAREPQVSIASRKRHVVSLILHGHIEERVLRNAAENVRDMLLQAQDITQVDLSGTRDHEIIVEIRQDTLRRYGLTIGDVADMITASSLEQGGGSLKTEGGEILVRVNDRRNWAEEFSGIPVITKPYGGRLTLADLSTVKEGFEDKDIRASFNGEPAVMLDIYRVGDQTPQQVARAVFTAKKAINASLPPGMQLSLLQDRAKIFSQRADLLLKNAYLGLALVFIFLALFLEIRLAFWVSLGIPISFLGSLLLLSPLDFSINMMSMFAFIITLGVVVDDAVVVGEHIFHYRKQGVDFLTASIRGAREIAGPVVFSVLTNMVAFLPMFFVPGTLGKIFRHIPMVVLCVFAVSLIECLFVLPAHLSHGNRRMSLPFMAGLARRQERFSQGFESFVRTRGAAFIRWVLRHRYICTALGAATLIAAAGYVKSGRMGMEMFPRVESDYAYAQITLPPGTPGSRVRQAETRLIEAGKKVVRENGEDLLSTGIFSYVAENTISARIFLTPADVRPISTALTTALWREATGLMPGIDHMEFQSNRGGPGAGKNLTVQLSHRDKEVLNQAGEQLAHILAQFPAVSDIDNGVASGKRQVDLRITPAGERMGLTSAAIARQVRHAFHGAEAIRQQRDRNEVTIRVRLPESERATQSTIDNLILLAPLGEIPLRDAATFEQGRAHTSIMRQNNRRIISVTANVDPPPLAENIVRELRQGALVQLSANFPGLSYSFEGQQADIRESNQALALGLGAALMVIYALLAIPFRSYVQPLIIMTCVPFSFVGVVLGHLIMGYALSLMSLFGLLALSGVVINGSLVMIEFANRRRTEGIPAREAIVQACVQRFRPILLTTLTTTGGLAPMIFETSRQARFLIPMAISLGFGILFAAVIILTIVPSLYIVIEDIKQLFVTHGNSRSDE